MVFIKNRNSWCGTTIGIPALPQTSLFISGGPAYSKTAVAIGSATRARDGGCIWPDRGEK